MRVKIDVEVTIMKIFKVMFVVSALALLAGCVAVPVDGGYYGGAPGYYAPRYYAPPAFYAPSFSIGVVRGGHSHRHWRR